MAGLQGQLGRSLGAMTFGVVREMNDRAERLHKTAMLEREQEFQVPILGTASVAAAWADLQLTFRVEFLPATGQRDSPLLKPTFTYGYEIEPLAAEDPAGDPLGIAVMAFVRKWRIDEREVVYGADMRVGAWNPGDGGDLSYKGKLHMVFAGFGAPIETELEDDE